MTSRGPPPREGPDCPWPPPPNVRHAHRCVEPLGLYFDGVPPTPPTQLARPGGSPPGRLPMWARGACGPPWVGGLAAFHRPQSTRSPPGHPSQKLLGCPHRPQPGGFPQTPFSALRVQRASVKTPRHPVQGGPQAALRGPVAKAMPLAPWVSGCSPLGAAPGPLMEARPPASLTIQGTGHPAPQGRWAK